MTGNALRDALLGLIRSSAFRPLTKSEFARKLNLPPKDRAEMRRTIDALVREGLLVEGRKSRYEPPTQASQNKGLTGILKFHPKGHAWFFPDLTDEANLATGLDLLALDRIQVPRKDCGQALDGDRVRVTLGRLPGRDAKAAGRRPRKNEDPTRGSGDLPGRVDAVLERRSGKIVGIFHRNQRFAWCETDDKAVEGRVELPVDSTAEPGQMVVVDLTAWADRRSTPRGRITEVLGWPGDPGVEIQSVIHRFGLRTSFPDEVLAAAHRVPEEIPAAESRRRRDWRDKLVITIDPADAKDHDDAIWVGKTREGWQLAVHIADVSHYIKPGSVMDREAIERGNSTYLVDRVLPMLPTDLSNGICSLKPDVDRLTKCALIDVRPDGSVAKAVFFDAIIHSRAKLSYEQAQAILDGKPAPKGSDPGLVAMVRESWKLAAALRARRFREGALDLEMPEIRVKLDEKGRATQAEPVIHTASHQLIEECMLAANEAVARVLKAGMRPSIYRIHEDPDPSRLMDYTETARLHGYQPGDLTNRAHIQQLLDAAKGSPEEHIIKLGLLKSLKRAAYSSEPIGHYGLAKADYCHFTSPIRRYADLIVHRALQPYLQNPPKPTDAVPGQAALRELSRHISDTERNSAEAESETRQMKLLEYLEHIAGAEDAPTFDGLVTDVRPMGLMVEIPDMGVRGVVKREDLPSGHWRFEAHRMAWAARDGRHVGLGMRVPLRVVAIDRIRRFVDFALAGRPVGIALKPAAAAREPRKAPPHARKTPPPAHKGRPKQARKSRR